MILVNDELDLMSQGLKDLYLVDWSSAQNLKVLNLHHNELTSLHGLPIYRQLVEINLSSNRIRSCDLPELSRLPSLSVLDLSTNLIESLDDLPYLPSVKVFSVAFNSLSSLSGIDALPNVEELDLRGNRVERSSELDHLQQLQQLRSLRIASNPISQQVYSIIRLFDICLSLQEIDGLPKSGWKEAQVRALEVATPNINRLVERFRASNRSANQVSPARSGSSSVPILSPTQRYYSPTRSHVLFPEMVSMSPSAMGFEQALPPHFYHTEERHGTPHYTLMSHPHHSADYVVYDDGEDSEERGLSRATSEMGRVERWQEEVIEVDGEGDGEEEEGEDYPSQITLPSFPSGKGSQQAAKKPPLPVPPPTVPPPPEPSPEPSQSLALESTAPPAMLDEATSYSSPYLSTACEALCTALHRLTTAARLRSTARAYRLWHVHSVSSQLEGKLRLQTAEAGKRVAQEKQRYDYLSRKHAASEMLAADLRRQVAQLEAQLAGRGEDSPTPTIAPPLPLPPPPPPAPEPPQDPLQAPAVVRERDQLQARIADLEAQLDRQAAALSAHSVAQASLTAEVAALREQVSEKEAARHALEHELHYCRERLANSDSTAQALQAAVHSLHTTLAHQEAQLEAWAQKDRDSQQALQTAQQQLADQAADLRASSALHDRIAHYDTQLGGMRAQLVDAEQRLGDLSAHKAKLEERLAVLTDAYNDIAGMNKRYGKELDRYKAKHLKAHATVRELTAVVKQLEDVIRTQKQAVDGCEHCVRWQEEVRTMGLALQRSREEVHASQAVASELKMQVAQHAAKDAIRNEQLIKLESTVKEIEDNKNSIVSLLAVKETIIKDQLMELGDLKRKNGVLEKDFKALQTAKEGLEYKFFVLEKDVQRLQADVHAKESLEHKLNQMVAEYLQFTEEQEGRRLSYHDVNLVDILTDIQGSAMQAKSSAMGREVCVNPRCQEQVRVLEGQLQEVFDKLQRQKKEFDMAYANKVEECKRISDALMQLEGKSREISAMIEDDKAKYEEMIAKLKTEKKKATKMCKALEEELQRKDHELRTTQQATKDLQEAFANFQKLAAKSK